MRKALDLSITFIRATGFRTFFKRALNALFVRPFNRYARGSFSQHGEDLVVDRLLGLKADGFYVDIGANDPANSNNTMRFYRKGWRGINIEPDPSCIARLQEERPRDINLNIGVASQRGRQRFYSMFPSTRSTFSREIADELTQRGFRLVSSPEIEILPLAEVLRLHRGDQPVDFISIDTEGYDEEVLRSNDWDACRPRVLCIETEETSPSHEFLMGLGYERVLHNGVNAVYLLPDTCSATAAR